MRRTVYAALAGVALIGVLACGGGDDGEEGFARPLASDTASADVSAVASAPAGGASAAAAVPARTVTAGAFCDTEGTTGTSKNGAEMQCIKEAGENRPRWRQSDGSVGAGTYEVGPDISAGKWTTTAPGESWGCYWQRSKDASGAFESIIANGNVPKGGPGIIQIAATDKFVTLQGDCRWRKTG